MRAKAANKYREAVEILQHGRNILVETLADDVICQGDDLVEGGFVFNEFLEVQGSRLHFLNLLVAQLEEAAEASEGRMRAADPPREEPAPPKKRPRPKSRKIQQTISTDAEPEDT